jgi:alpha-amylase
MKKLAICALLGSAGCMDLGVEPIEMSTHVDDWRDQVIYQVMIDRFENGDTGNDYNVNPYGRARWQGGDWAGLEARLDYLAELGVTALWISPVYENVETDADVDGYHGYWPQDFTSPNPHFGDVKSLRSLVQAAHDHGMLVIYDVVVNHVGQVFFYDINMNGHADEQVRGSGEGSTVVHINEHDPDFDTRGVQAETSLGEAGPAPIVFRYEPSTNHMPPEPADPFQLSESYNKKGRTVDFEDPDQLLHGDFPGGLKDLETKNCKVKRAMVESYARWIELTDADGFRIDTIKHVEREFWRYFTQKVRQRLAANGKRKFFMFGEAFDGRVELVGAYTKNSEPADQPSQAEQDREALCVDDGNALTADQLDGMFDFPQYYSVIRDVFHDGLSTDRIEQLWSRRPGLFGSEPNEIGTGVPPIQTLVNFLDNHDVPRFLFNGDDAALRLALLYIMTEQGIPCVYYGTEQGFDGGNDPANRESMWASGFDTGAPLFQWLQHLGALRRSYVALRRGEPKVTWASSRTGDEGDAGVFAFERTGGDAGDGYALVVFNVNRDHPSTPVFQGSPMVVAQPEGTVLVDVLGSGATYTVGSGGTLAVTLDPMTGAVLVPESQVAR